MAKEKKETPDFETILARLEEIVEKMESGGLTLAETIACFEEATAHVGTLTAMLAEAREKVLKLVPDGAGRTEPFEEEDR